MNILLHARACPQGQCLPLMPRRVPGAEDRTGHTLAAPEARTLPRLGVGTLFYDASGAPLLKIAGRVWLPCPPGDGNAPDATGSHAAHCPLLTALVDLPEGPLELTPRKEGRSLAWITLSDKGSRGQRQDLSGPAIESAVAAVMPLCHSQGFMLPDEPALLRALLTELALSHGYDLICTTGGTGLSPRDTAPQATEAVLDLPLPGFTQAMLAASLAKTPHAVISRAAAGTLGQSIIINLPGSRKAVLENLEAVLPALPHALKKLQGDDEDCGG